jgi:hypothetical protein
MKNECVKGNKHDRFIIEQSSLTLLLLSVRHQGGGQIFLGNITSGAIEVEIERFPAGFYVT